MTVECWWARYPWLIYHPKTLAPQKAKLTHKGNSVDTFYRNMEVNWFHFWKQLLSLPVTGNQNEAHNNPQVCTYKDLSLCIASPSKCNIKSKWAICYTKSLISNVHSKLFCPLVKNIWMLQNTRQLPTKLIWHRTNRHVSRTLHQGGKWTQKVKLMLLCPQCQLQVSEDADHTLHSQTLTIISTSSWPGHSSSKWVVHNAACKLLHGTNQR